MTYGELEIKRVIVINKVKMSSVNLISMLAVAFVWAKLGGYLNDVSWWWILLALLV